MNLFFLRNPPPDPSLTAQIQQTSAWPQEPTAVYLGPWPDRKSPGSPGSLNLCIISFKQKKTMETTEQLNVGSGNVWHTNGEEEETCFGLKIKENGDLPTRSLVLKLDEIWMPTSNRWCQVAFLTTNQTTSVIAANLCKSRVTSASTRQTEGSFVYLTPSCIFQWRLYHQINIRKSIRQDQSLEFVWTLLKFCSI